MNPPSGWYADPDGTDRLRWWDGSAWTNAYAPSGSAPAPSEAPQAEAGGPATDAIDTDAGEPSGLASGRLGPLGWIGAAVGLFYIVQWLGGGGGGAPTLQEICGERMHAVRLESGAEIDDVAASRRDLRAGLELGEAAANYGDDAALQRGGERLAGRAEEGLAVVEGPIGELLDRGAAAAPEIIKYYASMEDYYEALGVVQRRCRTLGEQSS